VSKTRKGDPIPAKFDPPEESLILDLARDTGLSQSEIIRRAVRLLGREIINQRGKWLTFLMSLRRGDEPAGAVAEQPGSYHTVAALEKAAKKLSGMKKRQAAKKSAA
jgi:hypothetical protein